MVLGLLRLTISARVTAALTLGYIGFYPLDYLFISRDFVTATVHLVFFLAIIKVLTSHATRDYIFLGIIGFLELLAASILSANLTFFVFLALFLVFGVATFASSEIRRSLRKPHNLPRAGWRHLNWRLVALTLSMSFGILVLTGGLFFLLPRTAQAAFGRLAPTRFHLTGFSNEVTLGQLGEIQKQQSAVMHARLVSGRPAQPLKWRGAALRQFDGKRWYNPPERGSLLAIGADGIVLPSDLNQRRRRGERIQYEVQLGPMPSDALFLAGTPELIRINAHALIRTSSDSYRLEFPNTDGIRYDAYSYLDESTPPGETAGAPLPADSRLWYLELPHVDGRIPELAREVTAGAGSDERRARVLEQYLQTSYSYTTKLLDHEVADPLANFLFDRRAGHCEYFASAMAVMLRTLGIPSRVATGFESGVYNPVSGWYVIRASDAHSWVEAYLPGRGWTTFDPTPPAEDVPLTSLWARMGFYMDAADTFWQEWVLNYNLDRQLTLASLMENSSRSLGAGWMDSVREAAMRWRREATAWARRLGVPAVLFALILVVAYLAGPEVRAWWRTIERVRQVKLGQACPSDATMLYGRMLRVMKRCGFEKPVWITPAEFARLLPASGTTALVGNFTAAYNDLRFGGDQDAARRMISLIEEIEHGGRN